MPVAPHTPLLHWSLAPHMAPAFPLFTHEGAAQYLLGELQSPSMAHAVLHAAPDAHVKPPGHAMVVVMQLPRPSHAPADVT